MIILVPQRLVILKIDSSMLECKVKEDKIIQMLQKYWDLRLSEAKMFVEHQKDAQ